MGALPALPAESRGSRKSVSGRMYGGAPGRANHSTPAGRELFSGCAVALVSLVPLKSALYLRVHGWRDFEISIPACVMTRLSLSPAVPSAFFPRITLGQGESKSVGRAAHADVVIDDPSLSRMHARLSLSSDGALTIEDTGSTNGVLVNDTPCQIAVLNPGDRVRFGFVDYTVARDEAGSSPPGEAFKQTILRVPVTDDAPRLDRDALNALLATSRELMGFGDLDALLERVLDRLYAILKPDRAAILLVDPATGDLRLGAARPLGAGTELSQFASSTVVRESLLGRDALLILDTNQPQFHQAASLTTESVRSALCVPLFGRTGAIGAVYADRRGLSDRFTPQLMEYAALFAGLAAAALETATLYDDRERHFRGTLEAFARAIDARDPYTAGHSERVAAYTLTLARGVGLPDSELETIRRAGLLHDIGKVGVRDAVLLKPGRLEPEERALMEAHTVIGHRMLDGLPFLVEALPAVRGHHERWDGTGYPDGLAGTAIHPHARLMAVADAYDAMTSVRPYRAALSHEEAARRVRAEPGAQFEPAAVEAFNATESLFHSIRENTASSAGAE